MHLHIRHEIGCRLDLPARNLVSILRLSPRSHEGQHVSDWWIDSDIDCNLKAGADAFGNLIHTFSAKGPVAAITVAAAGSVDTFDTAGVMRGSAERMPLDVFLRDTPLTAPDAALRALADEVSTAEPEVIGRLHALMDKVNATLDLNDDGAIEAAADALREKRGAVSALAHVFIATARIMGVPSRYVSGYLVDGNGRQATCHAWAEAYAPGLGWIGFDAASNLCPEGQHVRVAAGFDALGAAFLRGVDPRHTRHTLKVRMA